MIKTQLKFFFIFAVFGIELVEIPFSLQAGEMPKCQSIHKKPIKIEAWIAKKFKKEKKTIKKELASLGNTKVILRVFPMKEPAHVVAIGKCVPAYLARHVLKNAMKYAGGVEMLVDQNLFSNHWVGIGTMNFDEYSQRKITPKQLKSLLDESLTTQTFQKLIAEYSTPRDTFKAFGREVPNVRRSGIEPPLRNN